MKFLKFVLPLLLVLCLFSPAMAQVSWHTANQVTIGWDAYDNSAGNPGDAIEYNVYLKHTVTGAETLIGTDSATTYLITFITEGMFLAGVSTVRKVDVNLDGTWDTSDVDENGDPVILESNILWSDSTDTVAVPVPFGLRYFVDPTQVRGFGVR